MTEPKRAGVWRRGQWDWAYKFRTPRGEVFGCGFATRERAQDAMRAAKTAFGVTPAPQDKHEPQEGL